MAKTNPLMALLAALFMLPLSVMSQDQLFTLEDLNFGGTNYRNMVPQNLWLTWWGDQLMYQDADEGGTLSADGRRTPLYTLDAVNQALRAASAAPRSAAPLSAAPVSPPTVPGDSVAAPAVHSAMNAAYPYPGQPLVLLTTGRQRLLYDWQQRAVVWQQPCADEQHSNWNATSRAVAYVKDHQLCVRTADGRETVLTTDGSRDIVYGQAVHRNEFGIMEGTFWSPDGQRLAFYRMDQTRVADYPQVDIYPREATYEPDKYPMAGMTSHTVTVGIYDLRTTRTVYLATPAAFAAAASPAATVPGGSAAGAAAPTLATLTSPVPVYFTNVAFSPDGRTVYMFELNRDQNDCRLVSYDAATGRRLSELCRETSAKYVEPMHPIAFLPWNADHFLLQSQRDGYNHLYIYNKDGHLVRQLTSGPWVVIDVLGFNATDHSVIIASNEASPLQRNLYAVNIDTGRRKPLDNQRGVHHGHLSPSGQWLYDRFSEPTVPRCIDLVATAPATVPGGSVAGPAAPTVPGDSVAGSPSPAVRLLTAPDPWAAYRQPIFESGTLTAADGHTPLYWRMVKPHDFDPSRRYPTVVYVYGGPHAHNVDASWHWASRSWETYMAQKGYLLFILDNRGSENRGRDFEQATFRQLGQVEMQDQMAGVDFLRSLPYVDTDRIGVHGWSFGGFMTITLMLNHPDVFKVGVAGGPVIDWSLYEVMYGERYMDTPQQNPDGYALTRLTDKAAQLKGRLQIITGYNDPTVVPQHCLRFLDACIKAGTQPDFFAYPGEGHNMRGHASVHLHERITRYFDDHLK